MYASRCLWTRVSPKVRAPKVARLLLLVSLVLASLSGCSIVEQRDDELPLVARVYGDREQCEETMILLNQFRILDNLSEAELQSVHRTLETSYAEAPIPATRLQLAWLLSIRDSGFQDIPRAIELLDMSQETESEGLASIAFNDLAYVVRRTLMEQKLQQDEHRRIRKALDNERNTNSKLAKTIEKLEKKIEDLTQIEESMIQRKPLPETELK